MAPQLSPDPATPGQFISPERRIDVTLQTVRDQYEALPEYEQAELSAKHWWNTVVVVSRLRAMERGEEEAIGRPSIGLADIYDSLISPGEHACKALIRTFSASLSDAASPSSESTKTHIETTG